jgi:hypothetical protein
MKAWELSVWVLLALACRACVRSSEAESQPAYHWPQFHRVHDSTWNATQRSLLCLTSTGGWQLNNSKVIIDNIYLHAPCPVFYGGNNACNWTLDGNVLKYYWQPEPRCEVQIRPFHASTMCSLMKDRGNMMIVGDSVSEGAVKSWHNKFLSDMEVTCPPTDDIAVHPVPDCHNFNIVGVRNDYVSLTEVDILTGKEYQFPWVSKLASHNISLLVLNRGAHFIDDEQLLREVNETLSHVTARHPHVNIIWRNTPHGNHDYKRTMFTAPLSSPPELDYDSAPYHYGKFRHQNNLVEELIREHYPRVLYLDVFTATVLRLDSHYDALHLCVPGIIDTWLQFVYNALLLMAENHIKYIQRAPEGPGEEEKHEHDGGVVAALQTL